MATALLVTVLAACVAYPMLTRPCRSRMHPYRHGRWSDRHTR